jgi:hypothetical protein
MAESREDFIYAAKLAEQAERFDEMVSSVKQMVQASSGSELSAEERNLLSVAYKNVTGTRRGAWRILSSLEAKEEGKINGGTGNDGSEQKLAQTVKVSFLPQGDDWQEKIVNFHVSVIAVATGSGA